MLIEEKYEKQHSPTSVKIGYKTRKDVSASRGHIREQYNAK